MTGSFWWDWALISVSLFNTIVLLWLGLTVLLNVDRRSLGIWFMGGGLLMGAAFFISHTAILAHAPGEAAQTLDFWWQIGWIPVVVTPLAWYVMVLWYTGFWSPQNHVLRRRHAAWFVQVVLLGVLILGLMVFAHPLPTFTQIVVLDLSDVLKIGGIPVLFVLFPVFIVLCVALSLDALRHPAPSERLMGDLARERTRPWLMATAGLLVVVSLLVTGFVAWVVQTSRGTLAGALPLQIGQVAVGFDLLVEALIGLSAVVLGQGIVAYEVFTGRTLPRRGFFRYWRNAVVLAGGYAILIGLTLAGRFRPIYSLLITTALMTSFYALFSWRSFVERERFMARLRPFIGSQHLIQHLLSSNADSSSRATAVFQALCQSVLNARHAQLVPTGSLATLAGDPLMYPPDAPCTLLGNLPDANPSVEFLALEASALPYRWAIPLWAERGPVGLMLLGEKQDDSLYTQEEIEIARISGERLVDMLAGEEMARRLMSLQRRRLAETQVMDRRTRRALHDEVLPGLHTAVLQLGALPQNNEIAREAISVLSEAHHQIANLIRTAPVAALDDSAAEAFGASLRRAIEAEFSAEFDAIEWNLEDQAPPLDTFALEVLFHATREAVRNAALHARGRQRSAPLNLSVSTSLGESFTISIRDNGVGIPPPSLEEEQGGLALHSTMLAIIGGRFEASALSPSGTEVLLSVPLMSYR